MGNHYHLIVETPEANLSRGMRHLNASFCQMHHKKYNTVGHLFQGRFKAIIVDRESYLLELARYVVLNPVRAGLVSRPEDWPWSSYRAMAGMSALECGASQSAPGSFCEASASPSKFVPAMDLLLEQFGPDRMMAQQRYREFVCAGIGLDSPWPQLKSQIFLANQTFIDTLKDVIPPKSSMEEIPRRQRFAHRPHLKEIFTSSRTKQKRNECIVASYMTHGYRQKEIADFLGIHYTTVSNVIRRHDAKR